MGLGRLLGALCRKLALRLWREARTPASWVQGGCYTILIA